MIFLPHSSYILPEAMITALSTLTGLEVFEFGLRSPRSYPEQESRYSSPLARSVLSTFHFEGSANIWTPSLPIETLKLVSLRICFFNQIDFDTPHLVQFFES